MPKVSLWDVQHCSKGATPWGAAKFSADPTFCDLALKIQTGGSKRKKLREALSF